jgi:hypothetical protein
LKEIDERGYLRKVFENLWENKEKRKEERKK